MIIYILGITLILLMIGMIILVLLYLKKSGSGGASTNNGVRVKRNMEKTPPPTIREEVERAEKTLIPQESSEFVNAESKPDTASLRNIVRAPSGTLHIEDERESTLLIGPEYEDHKVLAFTMIEMRNGQVCSENNRTIRFGSELVVGRSKADIIIADETVSSRHMVIVFDENGLNVVDQASYNGTKVNGRKILSSRPCMIRNRDEVVIGRTSLIFRLDDDRTELRRHDGRQ